jgi:hypothetical protein
MVYVKGSQAVNPERPGTGQPHRREARGGGSLVRGGLCGGGVPPGLAAAICAAREGIETVASMR